MVEGCPARFDQVQVRAAVVAGVQLLEDLGDLPRPLTPAPKALLPLMSWSWQPAHSLVIVVTTISKYWVGRPAPPRNRRWLGQHDELAGGLVALHVLVGRDDVVQAEDAVDVGPVDAGLDLVDDPLQHGRARAALDVVAVEGREPGSGRDHRYRFEVRDRPPAERACHAHRPAAADQVQRVHDRARPDEIKDIVRAFGPDR